VKQLSHSDCWDIVWKDIPCQLIVEHENKVHIVCAYNSSTSKYYGNSFDKPKRKKFVLSNFIQTYGAQGAKIVVIDTDGG
jgi:hypothetical protein